MEWVDESIPDWKTRAVVTCTWKGQWKGQVLYQKTFHSLSKIYRILSVFEKAWKSQQWIPMQRKMSKIDKSAKEKIRESSPRLACRISITCYTNTKVWLKWLDCGFSFQRGDRRTTWIFCVGGKIDSLKWWASSYAHEFAVEFGNQKRRKISLYTCCHRFLVLFFMSF